MLQALIGPSGHEGEESFDMVVCTPEWLKQKYPNEIISGAHYVIVPHFDYEELQRFISSFARRSSGRTWREIAHKLSRLGKWEFEDYREEPHGASHRLE